MDKLLALPPLALVGLGLLVVVDLVLYVYCIVDLVRRPTDTLTIQNKWVWAAIILLVSTFGAIIYLAAGRKPTPAEEVRPTRAVGERAANAADMLYGAPKDAERR
jgi:hypothetical protein